MAFVDRIPGRFIENFGRTSLSLSFSPDLKVATGLYAPKEVQRRAASSGEVMGFMSIPDENLARPEGLCAVKAASKPISNKHLSDRQKTGLLRRSRLVGTVSTVRSEKSKPNAVEAAAARLPTWPLSSLSCEQLIARLGNYPTLHEPFRASVVDGFALAGCTADDFDEYPITGMKYGHMACANGPKSDGPYPVVCGLWPMACARPVTPFPQEASVPHVGGDVEGERRSRAAIDAPAR